MPRSSVLIPASFHISPLSEETHCFVSEQRLTVYFLFWVVLAQRGINTPFTQSLSNFHTTSKKYGNKNSHQWSIKKKKKKEYIRISTPPQINLEGNLKATERSGINKNETKHAKTFLAMLIFLTASHTILRKTQGKVVLRSQHFEAIT